MFPHETTCLAATPPGGSITDVFESIYVYRNGKRRISNGWMTPHKANTHQKKARNAAFSSFRAVARPARGGLKCRKGKER
jgi:hypothetical protein